MTSRRVSALLAFALTIPTSTFAAWTPNGNPLCTAIGAQLGPAAASDGSGGMIVAWQDRRRGGATNDIYAIRVLGDGTIAPDWPVDGVALSQSGQAGLPRAVPDGGGGALVLWLEPGGIYAQRVSGNGLIAPGFPPDGKRLPSEVGDGQFDAVTDGAGGAYYARITPGVPFSVPRTLLLGRVGPDADVVAGWPANGLGIGSSDLGPVLRIAPAPGGDCVYGSITVVDAQTNPHFAVAGRVHPNSTREIRGLPTYNVVPFPGNNPGPVDISVAPDGAGGIFALKQDSDGFNTQFENHGHHYDLAGNATWPRSAMTPFLHQLVSDGALGLYLINATGPTPRLEANYYTATGAPVWLALVLSQPTAFQNLRTAPLGFGGAAFACWSENPSGSHFDIKAAAVFPTGGIAPGSGLDGQPICTAAGNQYSPGFVLDGAGALACWEDQRSSVDGDIYANRILLDLATPVLVSLADAEVTSEGVRLRWAVADRGAAVATVMRRTSTSDWAEVGTAEPADEGMLSFEDRDVVPGTAYGYALAFADDPGALLGEHWVQVPARGPALSGFVPNPTSGQPRIAFTLRPGLAARLEVVDLAGRVVMTQDVGALGPGSHTIGLSGPRLAAGVYLVRLTEGDRIHTARGVVIR